MTKQERAEGFPTRKWWKRYTQAFAANGGHPGPATVTALGTRAIELYRLGGSAAVVGAACAREYRLYSDLQQSKEREGYGKLERAACEMHMRHPEGGTLCHAEQFGTAGRATADLDRVECQVCRYLHARRTQTEEELS